MSRLVIPDDKDLKSIIILENHDAVTVSHTGIYKIYLGFQKENYWSKMNKCIHRYVNACEKCQRNNAC